MIQKIKKILAILIAISFVVTFTATTVSAAPTVPTFDKPTVPTFDKPTVPIFDKPTVPTFDKPTVPTFDVEM